MICSMDSEGLAPRPTLKHAEDDDAFIVEPVVHTSTFPAKPPSGDVTGFEMPHQCARRTSLSEGRPQPAYQETIHHQHDKVMGNTDKKSKSIFRKKRDLKHH